MEVVVVVVAATLVEAVIVAGCSGVSRILFLVVGVVAEDNRESAHRLHIFWRCSEHCPGLSSVEWTRRQPGELPVLLSSTAS